MSALAEVTATNLSGKWMLDKPLSDSTEASLALQGVSWIARKTLAKSSIALSISQYTDEKGFVHFDTEQKTLGRTVEQKTCLDEKPVAVNHPLFGNISLSHRCVPVLNLEMEYLKEALEEGTTEVIELLIENAEAGWTSQQIVAVETVDGERRHTRCGVVKNGDDVVRTRIVYDWQGN